MTKYIFSTGVPGIDSLLDPDGLGYTVEDGTFVGCIAGPDGVGKSILGLHAAAHYARGDGSTRPIVVYASTDLSHEQAKSSWGKFALHRPLKRRTRLRDKLDSLAISSPKLLEELKERDDLLAESCRLNWVSPHILDTTQDNQPKSFRTILEPQSTVGPYVPEVHLLDLARYSAGDDWGLINRMLGLFADLKDSAPIATDRCNHLVILDAVEGLEAMVGDRDAFGLKRSRRSRLAQLVRVSKKVGCNLIFIIEQREEHVHLDEVFIADFVIRLRASDSYGYQRKTIEIEKARGVPHIRGRHEFQIRKGAGCDLGGNCADEPIMTIDEPAASAANQADAKKDDDTFAYVQVMPSLDVKPDVDPTIGNNSNRDMPNRWFGISPLDDWLRPQNNHKPGKNDIGNLDRLLAVVGESGTFKSRLGIAFAAQAFLNGVTVGGELNEKAGVVIISTEGAKSDHVKEVIEKWIRKSGLGKFDHVNLADKVMTRSISPRYLSSAGFMFRLRTCIRAMKKKLQIREDDNCVNLRVVIDNWTTLLDGHPALKDDPRLLQSLITFLRDEHVTACLIGTQVGSPSSGSQLERIHDLTGLEISRIHLWPVDFFGTRRVAVSASVSVGRNRAPTIYELTTDTANPMLLRADSNFTLYDDVDKGRPKRVDLKIKLYSGYHRDAVSASAANQYARQVKSLFSDLFPISAAQGEVVNFSPIEDYNELKDYVQSQQQTQLRHTSVFQVDEFWNSGTFQQGLADLTDYWNEDTSTDVEFGPISIDDGPGVPITLPRTKERDNVQVPSDEKGSIARVLRKHAFHRSVISEIKAPENVYSIPLHKDFGFLLADRDSWFQCKDEPISLMTYPVLNGTDAPRTRREKGSTSTDDPSVHFRPLRKIGRVKAHAKEERKILVGHVWNAMCIPQDKFPMEEELCSHPDWNFFFLACETIGSHLRKPAFDIDMRTTETLSSLILEIWFSELSASKKSDDPSNPTIACLVDPDKRLSIGEWVRNWGAYLYRAIRLLKGQMLYNSSAREHFTSRPPNLNAVAIRTWFAPAVLCQEENKSLAPIALPGAFSTRGDWHMAVAKGSRSLGLAHQAFDKLCSREMNIRRMQEGVGLPVRSIDGISHLATALHTPRSEIRETRAVSYGELLALEPKLRVDTNAQRVSAVPNLWLDRGVFLRGLFRSHIRDFGRDSSEFCDLLRQLLVLVPSLSPTLPGVFLRGRDLRQKDEKVFEQALQDRLAGNTKVRVRLSPRFEERMNRTVELMSGFSKRLRR
ncbi:MAG: ATPase domain-containing protein [Pirellulales bacterium]